MITLAFLGVCMSGMYFIYRMERPNWSDSDYYALVQKYSDAASQLTSMKAELESLREKLELSEDVRMWLGIDNAKMAEEIEKLKQDIERGEEVRNILVGSYSGHVSLSLYYLARIAQLQRSLRIARHKEFKRWKKSQRRNVGNWWSHTNPASYHNSIGIRRESFALLDPEYTKFSIRESITILRTLEPYPLP